MTSTTNNMYKEVAIQVLDEQISILQDKISQAKVAIDEYRDKIVAINQAKAALLVDNEPQVATKPEATIKRTAKFDKPNTSVVKEILTTHGPVDKPFMLTLFKGAREAEGRSALNKVLTTILHNQVKAGVIRREGPGNNTDIYSMNFVNNEQ